MTIREIIKFLGRYAKNPTQIGAVCPSSKFLSRKMSRGAKMCEGVAARRNVVVELGSGTGAVTKQLVQDGFASDGRKLYSIEFDKNLYEVLIQNYPTVKVVHDSAENIRQITGEDAKEISAVVSSLPLLSLPVALVEKVLSEVEEILPEGGVFVQYTYNLFRTPEKLGFKKMKHISTSFALLNLPPARVDVFVKVNK